MERAAYLREVQDWIIRPQLKTVPGVAGVDAIGGFSKHYQVQPDPSKLISLGLSFAEVAEAVDAQQCQPRRRLSGAQRRGLRGSLGRAPRKHGGDRATSSLRRAAACRCAVRDVAEVKIGRELRTGSASENGQEVVVGTALMLIGGNSRTVSAAVDSRMMEINKSLPPDIEAKTVLNRTLLVDATVKDGGEKPRGGRPPRHTRPVPAAGQYSRRAHHRSAPFPFRCCWPATAMVQNKMSGNLMSLGAVDFGLIVDGAVIIIENCLRLLAERQHGLGRKLSQGERLAR